MKQRVKRKRDNSNDSHHAQEKSTDERSSLTAQVPPKHVREDFDFNSQGGLKLDAAPHTDKGIVLQNYSTFYRQNVAHVTGLRTVSEAAALYNHTFRDNVEDDFFVPLCADPLRGEMDIGMIDGFLRYVLAMHVRSVMLVSLNYSVYVDNNGLDNVISSGLEAFLAAGDRSTFDVAVIPIRIAGTAHYVCALLCLNYCHGLFRCWQSTR